MTPIYSYFSQFFGPLTVISLDANAVKHPNGRYHIIWGNLDERHLEVIDTKKESVKDQAIVILWIRQDGQSDHNIYMTTREKLGFDMTEI